MINLLPKSYRVKLAAKRSQRVIVAIGIITAFFVASTTVGLLAAANYLAGQLDVEQATLRNIEAEATSTESVALEAEIVKLNEDIAHITSFFDKRTELSPVVSTIVATLPDTMYLSSMSYVADENHIVLTGFAPTRNTLVTFQSNLNRENMFDDVSFPPSNWVEAENIDFFVQLKLSES